MIGYIEMGSKYYVFLKTEVFIQMLTLFEIQQFSIFEW